MSVPIQETDEHAEERYQALLALEPSAATASSLIDALHDENWRVRKLAAELLARADPTAELVDRLIEVLGEKGRTGARNAAAAALGLLGTLAVPGLLSLLARPDPDQRKFAAEILGDLGRHEAVTGLVDAVDDSDANVRAAAAEALGRVGGPEAGRALEALLARAKEPLLRVAALEGLITLRRAPPLPRLVPLLSDPVVQRSAWRLLGHAAHPAAFGLLCRGLATPQREAAIAGLGVRGDAAGPGAEDALEVALRRVPDAHEFLRKALASSDDDVRSGALQVAPASGDASLAAAIAAASTGALAERGLKSLLTLGLPAARALLEGPTPAVLTLPRESRAIAAEALMRLADPALVDAAQGLLASGDGEGVELGLRLLGRSKSERAVAPLEKNLEDDTASAAAARALVALSSSFPGPVAEALERFLAHAMRPHALRALVRVAPDRAAKFLREAARSDVDALRAAAAGEAGQLGAEGLTIVSAALMDEALSVRRAAAGALGALPLALAAPLLERALADAEPTVLTAAAQACSRCGAVMLAPTLRRLLSAAEAPVASAALEALDRLGVAEEGDLERAARHQDPEVLKAVLEKGAWRESGLTRATALLTHPQWDVRVAAARVLATSGTRAALIPLHQALEREADPLARELLVTAAAALAGR